MKEKVIIKKAGVLIFDGPILSIPMKEEYIIQRSIEVFGDDDPCIIHQSFVIKEMITDLLNIFKEKDTSVITGSDFTSELDFMNYEDLHSLTFELVRKGK